jgi:hypothetical protein
MHLLSLEDIVHAANEVNELPGKLEDLSHA